MAEVGGMLAAAVIKLVAGQIGSAIGSEMMLQWNLSKDLEEMKTTLETLGAVLSDAERRSITEESVRLWLRRLKDAACDISDMLDKFAAPKMSFRAKLSMGRNMKKMREKLKVIDNQHKSYGLMEGTSSNEQQVADIRETASTVEEAQVVGRNDDIRTILSILSALSNNIRQETVFSIYGMGGIGKTTLAQMVYNDAQFKDYYKVWVYVSRTFNLNKIGNSIISLVSDQPIQMIERQMIQERLGKLLAGKKILIILDDLWETDISKLDELMRMLKAGKDREMVVIVTTRYEDIARKICSVEPYKLEHLKNDMCWTIIKQKSAFEKRHDKEQLDQIGRNIAEKCGGVALAAQSLGYLLHSKTFDQWEMVLKSDIWTGAIAANISSPEHNVISSLQLSYIYMQPQLRLCFAYCAIFPKGHKIVKDDLIHQWDALGFVGVSGIFSTGEDCVTHLLGMSFFQCSKTPSPAGVHGKNVTLLTMHDLVHDLCRSVIADEFLDASKEGDHAGGSSCRYALLSDCSKPLKSSATSAAKFRALRFQGCTKIEIHGAALSSAKYLRILDFSECVLKKLPPAIGKLKHLRYLNAPGVQDGIIPTSITRLSKLSYLNLSGSRNISALPKSIGEMEGLKHLDLSGCLGIKKLPESFQNLRKLVHLDLSHCEDVVGVLQSLENLKELQYLNLSHSSKYGLYLNSLEPQGVLGNLTKLRYLNLSGWMSLGSDRIQSFMEFISKLSNLEHLDLSKNDGLKEIPESFGKLSKLHTLDLSGCRNLKSLPDSVANSLKLIIVKDCHWLRQVIMPGGLPYFRVQAGVGGHSGSNLVLLKDANPRDLYISCLENVKSTQEARSIKLLEKGLFKLTLRWTRNAERSVEDMELLGALQPSSTLKRFELDGYNGVSFPAWFMDISLYLPNLARIQMENLPNCDSFPPLGELPSLEEMLLSGMDSITEIDQGFYGRRAAFPRLKVLRLYRMESLKAWNLTYSCGKDVCNDQSLFPSLQSLQIYHCPQLRLSPPPPAAVNWSLSYGTDVSSSWGNGEIQSCEGPLNECRLLHHLPALRSLQIESDIDLLNTSAEMAADLSSLESLCCYQSENLMSQEWLGELNSLKELEINECYGLTSLPDSIRKLSSLQSLSLVYCMRMASLPQWLGELTSLNKLEIRGCDGINSLPDSIQQLTNLQKLEISYCAELKQWCESDDSKCHLSSLLSLKLFQCGSMTSLPQWLEEATSLKKLEIWFCEGINSLPDSIQQLTNLQKLRIICCPALVEWCKWEHNKRKLAHIKVKDIDK